MAPPPPADLPLAERVQQLVKTLQFAWFAGHLVLLICIFRYTFSYLTFNWYSTMGGLTYRTAFISAALTYGIVVFKTLKARQKVGQKAPTGVAGVLQLLSDENVQYLVMALIWLMGPQTPLAMLPYGIYSVFHVATYTRANVIPTLQPPKTPSGPAPKPAEHHIAASIGTFVKTYYDSSMTVVSILEILLWVRLFLSAILFRRWSWVLIVVYTTFLRARFSQSSHVQTAFNMAESRLDSLVGAQGTPPVARSIWDNIKNAVRQFYAVTDVSKYTNGSSVPKKSS